MSINYQIVLQRLAPGGDWNFETISQDQYSQLPTDKAMVLRPVDIPNRFDHAAIIWNKTPVISLEDCQKEWAEYQADLADEEIIELRRVAYPSTGDQFDMQLHDQINGTTTWRDALLAVKATYPKIDREETSL